MKKIIRKIKFFFDVLVKSLTQFPYYKEIAKAKLTFSLKYLFFLFYIISLFGSLVFAGSISVLVLPKVPAFVSSFEETALALYPSDLEVNIRNGMVTTNQENPYYVDTLAQIGLTNSNGHIITINTEANVSDISKENTLILVTKDSIVTSDNNDSYRVYPIDSSTNLTLTKDIYANLVSTISPYLQYLQPALIILLILAVFLWPLVAAALLLVGELLYLLLFSSLFFIIVKLMKKDFKFKKVYQLAIHAATLPILLGFVVSTLGVQMPFLLGTGILLVFMILVVNNNS